MLGITGKDAFVEGGVSPNFSQAEPQGLLLSDPAAALKHVIGLKEAALWTADRSKSFCSRVSFTRVAGGNQFFRFVPHGFVTSPKNL